MTLATKTEAVLCRFGQRPWRLVESGHSSWAMLGQARHCWPAAQHTHAYMHVHMRVCTHVYTHVCTHVCTHVYTHVSAHCRCSAHNSEACMQHGGGSRTGDVLHRLWRHVYMHVYAHVCTYIHVHVYMHMPTRIRSGTGDVLHRLPRQVDTNQRITFDMDASGRYLVTACQVASCPYPIPCHADHWRIFFAAVCMQ